MTVLECRRDRLVHVLDLARMYRGWTRHEVAAALGREPSKMIPESGNPKLDLVVGISRMLEWSVDDVTDCLFGDRLLREPDSEALHRGALVASAHPSATAADAQRIVAKAALCRRDGRFVQEVETLQQALMTPALPRPLRAEVQVRLAEAHLSLWHLAEARALASEVLRAFAQRAPTRPQEQRAHAAAFAARGHAHRRAVAMDPLRAHHHAGAAKADLEQVVRLAARSLSQAHDAPRTAPTERSDAADGPTLASPDPTSPPLELGALAHTAEGALLACEVELGLRAPDDALAEILQGLDQVVDLDGVPAPMLESWGWWCVFGGEIALRHLRGAAPQRALGIFSNKAIEIADRAGSWALRERAFVLEHLRGGEDDATAPDAENGRVLDQEDIRAIVGTMGRFPHFRETGWALLRRAVVIE